MISEATAFTEFLQKANDTEKAHLRLEVEKLRRAESDWLHIVIRMLDHVFALFQAAVRSGRQDVADQIGHFQHACRDAARRIGVVPLVPTPGEAFDPAMHQLIDEKAQPSKGATIGETLATGYSFQGQLVRRALVALQTEEPSPQGVASVEETETPIETASAPAAPSQEPPSDPGLRGS
jgi:molecular chaperone GrpE (heat shock protein)